MKIEVVTTPSKPNEALYNNLCPPSHSIKGSFFLYTIIESGANKIEIQMRVLFSGSRSAEFSFLCKEMWAHYIIFPTHNRISRERAHLNFKSHTPRREHDEFISSLIFIAAGRLRAKIFDIGSGVTFFAI